MAGCGQLDLIVRARVGSHETGAKCQLRQNTRWSEAGDKLDNRIMSQMTGSQAGGAGNTRHTVQNRVEPNSLDIFLFLLLA